MNRLARVPRRGLAPWAYALRAVSACLAALALGVSPTACDGSIDQERGQPATELDAEFPASYKTYVARLARAVLRSYFAEGREQALSVTLGDPSPTTMEPEARLVVTLRTHGVMRGSSTGEGETLTDLVRGGVVGAIEDERFGERIAEVDVPEIQIEFSALFDEEALAARSAEELADEVELGRHALEFGEDERAALLTGAETLAHNYDHQAAFTALCELGDLDQDCYTRADTAISRFRSEHWIEQPSAEAGYYDLFRGHRVIEPRQVRADSIERAARANAEYLVEHQTSAGAFDYQYQPDIDELVTDDNTVRQAGATYAASKLASFFGDDAYVEMARRAIDNLLSHEHRLEDGSFIYWGRDDLGVTALGLLGLVELQHPSVGEEYKDAALRLARGISQQQTPAGRLRSRFESADDTDEAQQYYAGEALLALVRTWRRWPEEAWISSVLQRSFDYYRVFWLEAGEGPFVPWQAATWANAYLLTKDARYAHFAFDLVDWSVAQQNLVTYGSWAKDDYAGAYANPDWGPPSCGTATHSEPVPLAIAVAADLGDEARRERYLDAERHALRFILQLVITEPETFYMPSPRRSLGGVRFSLVDNDVRVDAVQHSATAYLHALEYLGDEL